MFLNLFSLAEVLRFIAWFLALVELILGLYVFLLNTRHPANRHVGALLLLFALNSYALGGLIGAQDIVEAELPAILLAATSAAAQPALLLVATMLLKPEWLPRRISRGALPAQDADPDPGSGEKRGWWRQLWWLVYGLAFLPLALTLIDVFFGSQLWYTGINAATYTGGFLEYSAFTWGFVAPVLRVLNIYLLGLAPLIPILYVLVFERRAPKGRRRLAWLLLATEVATLVLQFGLRPILGSELATLLSVTVLVFGYALASFQQMVSERHAQRGRLQTRLTLLLLAITLPLLMGGVSLLSRRASMAIEEQADQQLYLTGHHIAENVTTWLELNVQALEQLALSPGITSMDPQRQKPLLEAMDQAHPSMYLVSTTGVDGINIARSDQEAPKDYSDRIWVSGALAGELTFQVLIGRTSGEPAVVVSLPILAGDEIIGVVMFASDLDDMTAAVRAGKVGESGYTFVINELDQIVAHPDPELVAAQTDVSTEPAVRLLRQGNRGNVTFEDKAGQPWRAHIEEIENGWGVIVQQPESELLRPIHIVRVLAWILIGLGTLVLVTLTTLAIRQAVRPIGTLTGTATAIADGDLSQVAVVESEDEIGALARAFNTMTNQLRGLIGSLESQVAERTQALAQRSAYLEATAEVGRAAASILDADQLIQEVVELIRERFGLYYVGLFLVEASGTDDSDTGWAVLRAGTGEAGQAMLARGHRIRVGTGMVGWAVAHGQSRVAAEAGADAVRLATPELPETRSEAALALRSRGRVLGALTVQHTESGAFDEATMAVLQTMADQVAVALDNARLFAETQNALETAQRAFGQAGREAWLDLLRARDEWGYRYSHQAVSPAQGEWRPEMRQALTSGQVVVSGGSGVAETNGARDGNLAIPLQVRDQVVGVLGFRKGSGEGWTEGETQLLELFTDQLETALESVRLYEETRRRAIREQVLSQVTARLRETLDLETVLRTAAQETRQALGVPEVIVRLKGYDSVADQPAAKQDQTTPVWGQSEHKEETVR
jgi:GAF domain-containing protein/HAMP domain-containing protein